MINKRKKIPPKFGPEIRFTVVPSLNAPRRGVEEAELDKLTQRLLDPHLAMADSIPKRQIIRSAAHEAASLAWSTPFPLLILPELLHEKLTIFRQRAEFQDGLKRRCRRSNSEAA